MNKVEYNCKGFISKNILLNDNNENKPVSAGSRCSRAPRRLLFEFS